MRSLLAGEDFWRVLDGNLNRLGPMDDGFMARWLVLCLLKYRYAITSYVLYRLECEIECDE